MGTIVLPPRPVKVTSSPPVTIDGGSLGIAADGQVYNVPMPIADHEYSFALPDGTKSYEIKARNSSKLKLAFAINTSGTDYLEIPSGSSYPKDMLNTLGAVLYFQAPVANEVAQIIVYS